MHLAANGYPFLAVDARGRGNSEGSFRPLIQEAQDGYDVVEWLAKQPYCNGRVAMRGGSYLGYVQWATAKERPPHLVTIVPAAAPYVGADFPMRNNIVYPYIVQWLCLTAGRASQSTIFSDRAYWSSLLLEWHRSGRAFREIDAALNYPSAMFQEWVSHPEPDEYWDQFNPTERQYAQLDLPILTITGSYDDDQPGALEHYRQHHRYASPAARARHYLVIGPWDHQGTRAPRNVIGGLKLGHASLVNLSELHVQWYAWTSGVGPKPPFLRQPVAYYVMGAERWRYAPTLEAVTARYWSLFLDSTSNATDVLSAGTLSEAPARGEPDTYTYDPRDVDGPEILAEAHADPSSLTDQALTIALRGKALFYHSAPFDQDTEISGFFKLSAWISIDCPDTDVYISIYEISRDGSALRLSTDAMRARYREGLRTPRLAHTVEPLQYDFDRFTFVSRQIKRGHRLRLVIAPMGRLVEATFAQRNYNSGGVVASESVADARAVTVRLLHDDLHPSLLCVPLGHPEPERGAYRASPT